MYLQHSPHPRTPSLSTRSSLRTSVSSSLPRFCAYSSRSGYGNSIVNLEGLQTCKSVRSYGARRPGPPPLAAPGPDHNPPIPYPPFSHPVFHRPCRVPIAGSQTTSFPHAFHVGIGVFSYVLSFFISAIDGFVGFAAIAVAIAVAVAGAGRRASCGGSPSRCGRAGHTDDSARRRRSRLLNQSRKSPRHSCRCEGKPNRHRRG